MFPKSNGLLPPSTRHTNPIYLPRLWGALLKEEEPFPNACKMSEVR